MEIAIAAVAGATAGLAGVGHCAVMCGPLVGHACRGAAGASRPAGGAARQLRYQAGRLLSYATAGAAAGAAGDRALGFLPPWASLAVAGALAVSLAVAGLTLWMRGDGDDRRGAAVALGRPSRKKLRSTALHLRAVRALARGPATLGVASVLLPCGALWAALAVAAGTATAQGGAVAMATFAAVSGAGIAGAGSLVQIVRRWGPRGARASAAALLASACLLGYRPAAALASFARGNAVQATVPCPVHPGMTTEVRP